MTKRCVFLAIAYPDDFGTTRQRCDETECALWNEHLACCGLIAEGMVQGAEIVRRQADIARSRLADAELAKLVNDTQHS